MLRWGELVPRVRRALVAARELVRRARAVRPADVQGSLQQLFRPEGRRTAAGISLALAVGLACGVGLICSADPRASAAREIRLYGRVLPSGTDASELGRNWVGAQLARDFALELPDGNRRLVSSAALGAELDRARWERLLADARYAEGSWQREPRAVDLSVPMSLDLERATATLVALKDELDLTPRDARLDLDRGSVVPERIGRLLDIDRSLLAIREALELGRDGALLVFEALAPRRVASQLGGIDASALLGFFETPYDAASRARDRTFNLRLAASRLDGYVLLPGEEFTFNASVGPRDEANGYRVAKVIAQGELVDGIGGGTCQISGTLHAAALFAGLEIRERHPHTRPSAYIELGFDAAVVYPTLDLRLLNQYDFPVVLRERVEAGRVRAEVRGARRPRTITLIRRIDEAQPFAETTSLDPSLPAGVRVLEQRGVPGFDLHRYRIRRTGAHAVREVVVDHYPPTTQLVRVGSGRKSSSETGRPPRETPPEYLADELMVLSQPAELEAPPVELRRPGRFATPGWARTIGAPVWDAKP
ncbi:MAG: VanW family protein [Deltaproteobacteria bacterium]